MLSRLNFCVNSRTPYASKNKCHKPYFFTTRGHGRTKFFHILDRRESTLAIGHQDDNKNTYQASIHCSVTFKVFQKHIFSYKTLRPPSPKRQRRTILDRTRAGVPYLLLTMYPFSMTNEHVPLKFLMTKGLNKITKIHCTFNRTLYLYNHKGGICFYALKLI